MTTRRTTTVLLAAAVAATALGGCGRRPFDGATIPTPDPNVRGAGGVFFWTGDDPPELALPDLDPDGLRAMSRAAQEGIDRAHDDGFGLAIVATFPTDAAATVAAEQLRATLAASDTWFGDPARRAAQRQLLDDGRDAPITPPEAAMLDAARLAVGTRGIGWGGHAAGRGRPEDAVAVVGPVVIVTGLKAETATTSDPVPIHPIAHLWAAAGADVLLEGDRAGEGAIAVDASCTPRDATVGVALRDAIGDTADAVAWYPTPPWVAEPTDDQRAARHAIGEYQALAMTAFDDPGIRSLIERLGTPTLSATEREALTAQLTERMQARVTEAAAGRVDPEIIALLAGRAALDDPAGDAERMRRGGDLVGQVELRRDATYPTADAAGPVLFGATARTAEGRLDVGWAQFGRASTGLPLFLAWLTEHGCTGMRIRLVDADAVRP